MYVQLREKGGERIKESGAQETFLALTILTLNGEER